MHCNLGHPRVIFRFNYDRHAKFEVAEPIHCRSVFAADTLLYAVTLTFDPVTLTVNL